MSALAIVMASGPSAWTAAGRAEVISAAALVILTLGLYLVGRRPLTFVTSANATYNNAAGTPVTLDYGARVPDGVTLVTGTSKTVKVSVMRLLVIGADNRTSTSKCVAFAWTYALVFGLFAIIVAKWWGDSTAYKALVKNGTQPEYWLLLGGPYAAAIAAKVATTSQSDGSGKTTGPVDGAKVGQLVTNDDGNGDLGDFQYVIFNALALAYYLGAFIPHMNSGLPDLPKVLTGLALTSAGAYSAKKFLQQAPPTLASLIPTSVAVNAPATATTAAVTSSFQLWGNNLIIPSATDGTATPPVVIVGGFEATVTASQQTMGADHLTVQLPDGVKAATAPQVTVTAVRADGIAATGPGGTPGLHLTVTP